MTLSPLTLVPAANARQVAFVLVRTFDQLAGIVRNGPQVLAFFSMVEVRKSLHREVMAELRRVHALSLLGASELTAEVVSETLPVLLKTREDIDRAAGNVALLLQRAC